MWIGPCKVPFDFNVNLNIKYNVLMQSNKAHKDINIRHTVPLRY